MFYNTTVHSNSGNVFTTPLISFIRLIIKVSISLYQCCFILQASPEFKVFLSNFTNLYSKIKNENQYASFFTGDFNGHSQFWWPDGDTTSEGREMENLISSLNLSQLISEPTNFEPNKNPYYIDLFITDQPNIVHEITYCKVNFNIPPPPPFERKIWYYDRANIPLLKRSMFEFPWLQHSNINQDPNWQVKTFTIFFKIL